MKNNTDIYIYDALAMGIERNRFFTFEGENERIRRKILKEAREKVFLERDQDSTEINARTMYERAAVYYVSKGDIEKIAQLLSEGEMKNWMDKGNEEVPVGELSTDLLVQAQSLFISAVTICTRAATEGGLPELIAFNLSDAYIQNALVLKHADRVVELLKCMVYDFTYEVYRYKYRNCTPLVRKCCDYISRHLHEAITLDTLSKLTGKTTNYISDSFYKDINMRPTLYIRKVKLDYAKHVFESADFSVAAVSDLLAFPSCSSFITYFKAEFGVTPLQFKRGK